MRPSIWIVTFYDEHAATEETIVTAFDNEEAARSFFHYGKDKGYRKITIDECEVYHSFTLLH